MRVNQARFTMLGWSKVVVTRDTYSPVCASDVLCALSSRGSESRKHNFRNSTYDTFPDTPAKRVQSTAPHQPVAEVSFQRLLLEVEADQGLA